jgi:putative heme iron utilization protein
MFATTDAIIQWIEVLPDGRQQTGWFAIRGVFNGFFSF